MIKKASVRVCAALLALMLIAASLMTAFADIQSHMDDTAAVFTNPEQYSAIESKLEQSSEKTGWNILFHSVNKGYKGDSLKNYADNYLNQNGLSGNALLYVYDASSKKSKILTAGEVDKYFNHTDRLDDMVDKLEPYTKKGDIAGAVMKFGDEAVAVYNMGKPVLFVESLKHFGVIAGLIGVAAGVTWASPAPTIWPLTARQTLKMLRTPSLPSTPPSALSKKATAAAAVLRAAPQAAATPAEIFKTKYILSSKRKFY